ncbi:hypothetical protein ACQ4LE_010719 [Meloidogyne hapla]
MPKSPKTSKSSKPSKSHKSPKSTKATKKKEENKDVILIDPQKEKENEQKKAKQPNLTTFFKPLEKPAPPPTLPQCMPETSVFKSLFQLKQGMTIAPILARKVWKLSVS